MRYYNATMKIARWPAMDTEVGPVSADQQSTAREWMTRFEPQGRISTVREIVCGTVKSMRIVAGVIVDIEFVAGTDAEHVSNGPGAYGVRKRFLRPTICSHAEVLA